MNTIEISNDELSDLLTKANEIYIENDCFEGSLHDNFIFYDADAISINGKSSKYIIVKENYLNEWSSNLLLTMTDSIEEVKIFKANFN